MHPLIQTILLTVLAPAAVAGLCGLLSSLAAPGRWRSGLIAAGVGAAWCVGVWLTVRAPAWPPKQASDWHFLAVVLAMTSALVTPWWRGTSPWRPFAGFVFFAAAFAMMTRRFLVGLWPGAGAWFWPLGSGALALASAYGVGAVGRYVQAAVTLAGLVVFAMPVSVVLTLAGAASLGHAAGVFASACGAAWLVAFMFRRQVDMHPTGWVAATVLGGLVLQGVVFGGVRPAAALLLALAWPLAAFVAWLLRRGAGSWRVAFTVGALAICGAGAVWLQTR
jgi:hypothetical protein